MREGYLSFDIDEVKRLSESDSPNAEAYGYLYQAVTTQAGTAKGIDDAYPETAEETARMLELLNMAKKALVDKDALELPVAGDTRCDTYGGLPFLESGPEAGKRGEQAGECRSSRELGGN